MIHAKQNRPGNNRPEKPNDHERYKKRIVLFLFILHYFPSENKALKAAVSLAKSAAAERTEVTLESASQV